MCLQTLNKELRNMILDLSKKTEERQKIFCDKKTEIEEDINIDDKLKEKELETVSEGDYNDNS